MTINLEKGQKINLEKEVPSLKKIIVGLGWDVKKSDTSQEYDIDSSVFILGENEKILSDKHFVFYNNLVSPDGAIHHNGDNQTGLGDGDDETITVDLTKIEPNVTKVSFVVTIHKAEERNQNFGQINKSYIRVYNADNNQEIAKYDLSEDFSTDTVMELGNIYRYNNEWKFSAVGLGKKDSLLGYLNQFK